MPTEETLHHDLLRLIDGGAADRATRLFLDPAMAAHRLAILRRFTDTVAMHPDMGTDRMGDRIRMMDVGLALSGGERPDLICARNRAHSLAQDFAHRRTYAQFYTRRLNISRAYDLRQAHKHARAMTRLYAYARFLVVVLEQIINDL